MDNLGEQTRRGPTICKYLNGLEDGVKIDVGIDINFCQPTKNATLLANFCGTLARDGSVLRIDKKSWRTVDKKSKAHIWDTILTRFEIDKSLRGYVMKSVGKKWRDHKSRLKTKYYNKHANDGIRMPPCPPNVHQKQWETLVHYWRSEDGKQISRRNKDIRKRQILPHTSGSKSFARVRYEERMKSETQTTPSRVDVFMKTHSRKDGKPVNAKVETKMAMMQDFIQNPPVSSDGSTSQMDAYTYAMGDEKAGRVRGLGLGPTPSSYFRSSSNYRGLPSELTTMKGQVQEIQTQLA